MRPLRLLLTVVGACLLGSTTAIYPADHWNFSTELTGENFESFINDNLKAGKTTFVRWIASSGWYVILLYALTCNRLP